MMVENFRGDRRRRILLFVVAPLLLLACGCGRSIVGHWQLVKSIPNRETFAIDNLVFAGDGSYHGDLTIDGRTASQTGAYDFSGFKLTLRPSAGGQRSFNANRRVKTLELIDGDRQVTLERTQ